MKDESRLRFLIVDDEQSIRRLCMTVGQGLNFSAPRRKPRKQRSNRSRRARRISSSPI